MGKKTKIRRVEGKLTDAIIEDFLYSAGFIILDIEEQLSSGLVNPRALRIARQMYDEILPHLYFFDDRSCAVAIERYNSVQIRRDDVPVCVMVEGLIVNAEYLSHELTYGSILNELSCRISEERGTKISLDDEKYISVLGKLAKSNHAVGEGYMDHYNLMQKGLAEMAGLDKRKEIIDIGGCRFGISLEDIV